jgi:hypothetical protein
MNIDVRIYNAFPKKLTEFLRSDRKKVGYP